VLAPARRSDAVQVRLLTSDAGIGDAVGVEVPGTHFARVGESSVKGVPGDWQLLTVRP